MKPLSLPHSLSSIAQLHAHPQNTTASKMTVPSTQESTDLYTSSNKMALHVEQNVT